MSDGVDLAALDALHAAGQFDQVCGASRFLYLLASSQMAVNQRRPRRWRAAPNASRQTAKTWSASSGAADGPST
jgi:hypothetical protein